MSKHFIHLWVAASPETGLAEDAHDAWVTEVSVRDTHHREEKRRGKGRKLEEGRVRE